jgi:outer membrane protein assembly factor BamB
MVLGASDGVLLAVDVLSGALVWKAALDFEVTAAPTFVDGKLLVTSESNQVVALDGATGKLLWAQSRPSRLGLTMQGHGRATVAHDQVFASFSDGFAMAMSLETGQIVWARPLSLRSGSFIDADATPVVADGRVFVASLTDGIYALTANEGETVWHHPVADVVSLVHTGNILFAADTQGHVYLLDPLTGQLRNQVHLGARPLGALTDLGDAVALTAGSLGLVLLSPTTGKPLGSQSLGGLPGGELAVGHGLVAHLSRSGHVMLWQHEADASSRP